EKPFFKGLVDFITSGPLVAAVLEGPNAIAIVRAMNGATRPHEAAPGSIRGDFAVETSQNLVHASDSPETAAAEIALWFKADELLSYEREVDRWVLAPEG
ncbi:MAG: nucleoside-diphosphate kinase, partial [Candidatus Limnocylindrales bacterium]